MAHSSANDSQNVHVSQRMREGFGECYHVLLAEDNEVHVTLAEAILESAQCTFLTVRNGAEAVAAARATSFDLMLVDFHMQSCREGMPSA